METVKRSVGDHFTIYTNIKSLYCTLETNIMLYVSCTSIIKRVFRKRGSNKRKQH